MGVEVDPDLSKISFERSYSSGSLRGELHLDVWRCLGSCSVFRLSTLELLQREESQSYNFTKIRSLSCGLTGALLTISKATPRFSTFAKEPL
ncbi:hypothetical protein ACSBR1_024412 [Camellia fascicularis]